MGATKGALSATQLAKRAEFATRRGLTAGTLDGPWHIVNGNSGKCLTIFYASSADNANAVQFTCDYSSPYNGDWAFTY
ncbi:RICIN domain-containing protein [Dactylosporangium sp. CA-092794]|uniref:RICIN domain-containing protein n=1 Tax=Dactylosporangium sp. CA-092794 TaxID=3239929 RepID=UPI003D905812